MDLILKEVIDLASGYKNIPEKLFNKNINAIETDSRKIQKGNLFFALKGDTFDGHDFADKTVESGAVAVVVQKILPMPIPQIIVKDTTGFLGKLAEYYKSKFDLITIAVTGSCGKTTTKDMIHSVLKTRFNVVTNSGNLNNHIGVPLTVFKLTNDTEILLSETGMNHAGELKYLAKILKPDMAIITNVEPTHLEGLGSIENIAKAKFELIAGVSKGGTAFLNWDNEYIRKQAAGLKCEIVKYGFSKGANFTFKGYSNKNSVYTVDYNGVKIISPLAGFHNVHNLLITCAVAEKFMIPPKDIKKALDSFEPSGRRMKIVKNKGITIIDDCYNASPTAVLNAIKIFDDTDIKGKRYFVFGDMFELGKFSEQYHKLVGKGIQTSKIYFTLLMGSAVKWTLKAIGKDKNVELFAEHEDIINFLKKNLKKGDGVLIKASHSMKFEKISSSLY